MLNFDRSPHCIKIYSLLNIIAFGVGLPWEIRFSRSPLSLMWPEDMNEAEKQFNTDKPGGDQDILEEVTIIEDPSIVDFQRLIELTNDSERGSSQLAYLVNNWEYKQANAVRLLREEIDSLSRQQHEVELKKLEILEERRILDERYEGEIDAEYDTIKYWKQQDMNLETMLEASIQKEKILQEKLQESIGNLEKQPSSVEEVSQVLKRTDTFLHFVLQNAPVIIGHQDEELRYRFIYNHFSCFREEDVIGKTDVEIFTGGGVKESQDFKREVLEKGKPAKREITFETDLFGFKTFLIYVEPVFSKANETIGINYMGMEVTDQVRKREQMAKLREEIAVQKAKETGGDQDTLEEVTIIEESTIIDFQRLLEPTNYSEGGSSQLSYLVNNMEYKQANAVRLLREELDSLSRQQHEVNYDLLQTVPRRKNDDVVESKRVEIDAEYDTVKYWKQRVMNLEILLEGSIQREKILLEKLQESIENLERQSSPVEELSQVLKRADNFLHFVLQTAPFVIGHQDKELRYKFIYNHFPSVREEDIIGKTDLEIFSGVGIKEFEDFKREVLEKGKPAKREITFETELFGSKTFLIYVEHVFSKANETIGVNYVGMEVTDQDEELRYRFIYNHFPHFKEEDVIGKTDVEIFTGGGIKESQDFKREVLQKGKPAKREITFETELFGSKTFLIYVEPVFSKANETIGINYMGMEVTDQVRNREQMAKLREEIAVQKAKETGGDKDTLEEVTIIEEPTIVDFQRLLEPTNYSEEGSQQAYLVNNWEYKQANAVRLLREELDSLSRQQHEVNYDLLQTVPRRKNDDVVESTRSSIICLDRHSNQQSRT